MSETPTSINTKAAELLALIQEARNAPVASEYTIDVAVSVYGKRVHGVRKETIVLTVTAKQT